MSTNTTIEELTQNNKQQKQNIATMAPLTPPAPSGVNFKGE
jgi:hypothetical protein